LIKIINGDSIKELKKFPDNYFHSVVTDPPYGLSFMGKKWDYDVPSVELWTEVFRVLKEGGYLLSFAGTRTQHRMAVNIEDAGFEIRDMIAWVYGSGFPKSHNIGKAVDKLQGNEREVVKSKRHGGGSSDIFPERNNKLDSVGNSEWEGWGTALKPALEPITMARKPFKTSVAENVLKNGVGGINIDGCRVGTTETLTRDCKGWASAEHKGYQRPSYKNAKKTIFGSNNGRFPSNLIHDGSDEVTNLFPESNQATRTYRKNNGRTFAVGGGKEQSSNIVVAGDKGCAARFFYCAKASKQDRNEGLEDFEDKLSSASEFRPNHLEKTNKGENGNPYGRWKPLKNNHPTVKPTDLMRYLVRLVTPKEGIVLDCFMGSGSTGKACAYEGFNFVGIDLDKDYCEIAKARIDKAIEDKRIMDSQLKLF